MFFIKVYGKVYEFANDPKDDFLQFLPKHFGCSFEEMEVTLVPDELLKERKREVFKYGEGSVFILPDLDAGTVSLEREEIREVSEEVDEDTGEMDESGKSKKKKVIRKVNKSVRVKVRTHPLKRVATFPYAGSKKNGKQKFMGIK